MGGGGRPLCRSKFVFSGIDVVKSMSLFVWRRSLSSRRRVVERERKKRVGSSTFETLEGENLFRVGRHDHVELFFRALFGRESGRRDARREAPTAATTPRRRSSDDEDREEDRRGTRAMRLFNVNTWQSFFIGGPRRFERLDEVVEHVGGDGGYDACSFQELFTFGLGGFGDRRREVEYVLDGLRCAGFEHDTSAVSSAVAPRVGQNDGLLVVSKTPLRDVRVTSFPLRHRRTFSAKGTLSCTVSDANGDDWVGITTTHLEHKIADHQIGQIDAVRSRVAERDTAIPHIVVGDFNICPRRAPDMYARLRETLAGSANLTERAPWTCDLRMAKMPKNSRDLAAEHTSAALSTSQTWGATIDHCWVFPAHRTPDDVHPRSSERAQCEIVSLADASDHVALAISVPTHS